MLKIKGADDFRRKMAGLALILAPLTLMSALAIHPGEGDGGFVQTIAENPGRVELSNLLIILSSLLFIPAFAGLLRLVSGRGAVLGHIGVCLAVVGVVGHAVWAGFQIVLVGLVGSGIGQAQLAAVVDGGPPPGVGFVAILLMFLVGFFAGVILLAAGLWRSGAAPKWAVACIAVTPLFDFLPTDNKALFMLGPALAVIGFGAIGLRMMSPSIHTPATAEMEAGAARAQ